MLELPNETRSRAETGAMWLGSKLFLTQPTQRLTYNFTKNSIDRDFEISGRKPLSVGSLTETSIIHSVVFCFNVKIIC